MKRRILFALIGVVLLIALILVLREREPVVEDAAPPAPPEAPSANDGAAASTPMGSVEEMTPPPADFLALQEEVLRSIPNQSDLRGLNEDEVHFTPDVLVTAGQQLGRFSKALREDPKLVPHGIKFYESCTLNTEFPTSVRALCYADLKELLLRRGLEPNSLPSDASVPDEIRELADQLAEP